MAAFQRAVELAPRSGWAREVLANAYRSQEDWGAAISEYERSVQVEPRRSGPYQSLIAIFQDALQNLEGQLLRYQELRRQNPDAIWVYGVLGAVYNELERYDEAFDAYLQMTTLDPGNAEAHYQLAQLYLGRGNGRKALLEYQIYLILVISGGYSEEAADRSQLLSGYAITSPVPNAQLSGRVAIRGTATLPDFQFYKVEYGIGRNPGHWSSIGEVVREPVIDGELIIWDTTSLPPGEYVIRLTVVDTTGNYPPPYEVAIKVEH
jgi:tetratricopeptide (TPR) repeat protein